MSKTYKQFIKETNYNILDKNRNLDNFCCQILDKLQSMFCYEGLPDTIPEKFLEYYLMVNGNAFVTEVDGNLYAFTGGIGGTPDVYYQPTQYIVANPALNLSKSYEIDKDGVLIRNDTMMQGLMPIIKKYGVLLVESDITIRSSLINMRMFNTITASDDNTKKSADEFVKQVENGNLATIGENPFFEGIKQFTNSNVSGYMNQIIEMTQYLKASFYNELGLNANYNLKREYISTTENSLADDILLPFVDNMLNERREGLEKINQMFGTEITVEFASSWKANTTQNEKEISDNEKTIETNDGLESEKELENLEETEVEENESKTE